PQRARAETPDTPAGRRGAGAAVGSARLDVHRDFVELQIALESLLDLVRDGVRGRDVRILVHGDGHLGVSRRGAVPGADAIRPLDPVDGFRRPPDGPGEARAL